MPSVDEIRRKAVLRRLYIATGLCSCFLLVEAVGGYLAGSLAILSDAAHLFADLASFAVASKFPYLLIE
jgi:zinc transporter 2